jgi:hypothetical protein
MADTFLATPVPEADALVRSVAGRQMPSLVLGEDEVLAHITALGPFLPAERVTPDVVARLRGFFAGFPAFQFALTEVRVFEGGIVYLAPEPPAPFIALTAALAARYPETPPYGGRFEEVIPHLTVGFADQYITEAWLRQVASRALPLRCRATEVRLVEADEHVFITRHRFPLQGG